MKYMQSPEGHIITTNASSLWSDYTQLPAKEGEAAYHKQQCAQLRKWLKPGSTVWTILRHVSSSGMSRRITCIAIVKGEPLDIGGYVADVTGHRRNDSDGALVVNGCGMDMGFSIVYNLSRTLWPKGHKGRDGGYALNHRWL